MKSTRIIIFFLAAITLVATSCRKQKHSCAAYDRVNVEQGR